MSYRKLLIRNIYLFLALAIMLAVPARGALAGQAPTLATDTVTGQENKTQLPPGVEVRLLVDTD